jgi:hypothetical protein
MKTVIYDPVADLVINVGMGEPSGPAPSGLEFIVVENDVYVGPGCKRAEDGTYYMPPSDPE